MLAGIWPLKPTAHAYALTTFVATFQVGSTLGVVGSGPNVLAMSRICAFPAEQCGPVTGRVRFLYGQGQQLGSREFARQFPGCRIAP